LVRSHLEVEHARHAEEVAQGLHEKGAKQARARRPRNVSEQLEL